MNKYIIFMTELQTNLVLNNMFRYVCKIWVDCMNTKTQGCYSNILKNECNAIQRSSADYTQRHTDKFGKLCLSEKISLHKAQLVFTMSLPLPYLSKSRFIRFYW